MAERVRVSDVRDLIPDTAVAVRLIRPVGEDGREYQTMECNTGAEGIRRLFAQSLVRSGEYGMADILSVDDEIVGEVPMDRRSFQLVKRRLGCQWVRPKDAPRQPAPHPPEQGDDRE